MRGWVRQRVVRQNEGMTSSLRTVIPVWIVAAVGAVVSIVVIPPGDRVQAIQTVMVAAVFLTFVIQVALARRGGLVDRIVASLVGSIVILTVATLVVALLAVAGG